MIASSNLIILPYTPDLSEGGIAYACRSLAYTYGRMDDSPTNRLRRIAGGVAVELAFRRYLSEQAIPFAVLDAMPFTQPDHYNVALGGHRCDIINFLITHPNQVAQLHRDPAVLLQAPALIPLDQFAAEGHKPDDLYLFAFLPGVVTAAMEDVKRVLAAGQPVYLIHPLPDEWRRPANWLPLEQLAMKSESGSSITVEIGGLEARRDFITAGFDLPPRTRTPVPQEFYSLAYIQAGRLPEARLGLHSPVRVGAYIVQPYEWGNIWIQCEEILLAGWLTHEEFRSKATVLNAGAHTFQYDRTRAKNLLVRVGDLNPIGSLLEKVRLWEAKKNRPTLSS